MSEKGDSIQDKRKCLVTDDGVSTVRKEKEEKDEDFVSSISEDAGGGGWGVAFVVP